MLELLKANLGISLTTTTRDEYLQAIIDSVTNELENTKGLDLTSQVAQMFVVDYAAWRYRERGEGIMPRNLQYRLHNLMVSNSKVTDDE